MTKTAVAYMRTSSAAGCGDGKDSEPRQRAAISEYAASAGYAIADDDWYYDPKVKGKDSINTRPGFAAMLERIASNGVRTIIVETANRFARDLIVQETGWKYLKGMGITLIAADSPDAFVDDTPTANMIRQILGAVAEFEKASLVAKLAGARNRKRLATGKKVGGRQNYAETHPEMVARATELRFEIIPARSLRQIAELLEADGYLTTTGKRYAPMAIKSMLARAA